MTLKRLTAAIVLGLAHASPAAAQATDEAAIHTIIESVATFADRNEYEALERLYATQVLVDYTSLAGGEPQIKSNYTLMAEWASLLPGFDRTRHAISNIRVTIDKNTAKASADLIADHWLNGQHWQLSGRYDYGLVKQGRDWKINFHKLTVTSEVGSRDILSAAVEAAKTRATSIQRGVPAPRT
jgi:ketosteroid isomerase-like protein